MLYSRLWIIFILLFLLSLQVPLVKAGPLESSFVYLQIKNESGKIAGDYFFEILDRGDYILIPVNSLAQHLKFQTTYNREGNYLLIVYPPGEKEILVDFAGERYPDYPEWSHQPPIQQDGDFFVAVGIIATITGFEIEWNPRRQELIIITDWPDKEGDAPSDQQGQQSGREGPTLIPDLIGPDYSLGSLQYTIKGKGYKSEISDWLFSTEQGINFHGRLKDWSLSVGLISGFYPAQKRFAFDFPLIQATRRDENSVTVLGDSRVNFPRTVIREDIRGLNYQASPGLVSSKFPLITVKGSGQPGEVIKLFINGEFWEEIIMSTEGEYYFKSVPLIPHRSNNLKIVIQDPKGEREEIIREVVGYPQLLQEGSRELNIVGGLYGSSPDWEGNILGLNLRVAALENLTLGIEGLRKQQLTPGGYGDSMLGTVVGLTARPLDGTIVELGAMIGGYRDNLDPGFSGSILQVFPGASLEAAYSWVQPEVIRTIPGVAGHRLTLGGDYSINPSWGLSLKGDFRRSFPEMPFSYLDRGILRAVYREDWGRLTALSLIGGRRGLELEIEDQVYGRADGYEGGFAVENIWRNRDFDSNLWFQYLRSRLSLQDNQIIEEDKIEVQGKASWLINPDLRLNFTGELETILVDGQVQEGKLDLDSYSRLTLGDSSFLTGRLISRLDFLGGSILNTERGETRAELSLLHFTDFDTSLRFNAASTWFPHLDRPLYSVGMGLTHFPVERQGSIRLDLGVRSPIESRETFQLTGSISLGWSFSSGLEASLGINRSYPTIFATTPEYGITAGISQTFGFTPDRIVGLPYDGISRHHSFIGGRVFLDLNGNGQYDPGEPVLENIPIVLGGLREWTDQDGEFMFSSVQPGIYRVGFDLLTLPAEYSVVSGERIVEIRANENFFLDFELTVNGVISGRVFLDRDVSGTFSPDDEPLSFVGLYLETLDQKVYTRRDGTFYLENVPLGQHQISVLLETLPFNTRPVSEEPIIVTLSREISGVEGIQVPIIYDFGQ